MATRSPRRRRSTRPHSARGGGGAEEPATLRPHDDLRARSALLWEEPVPRSRGPKPTLTRDDVVTAAVDIADGAEGLSALTMHAVAGRLGVTTMALYRYFPSKEALIDGCVDAALGTPPLDPRDDGWRSRIKRWAYAKRAMLCARPWLAELPFVAAPHGPNWLSWHEAFLRTLADTQLGADDQMDMLSVVDGYVRGNSDTAISLARARARGITFDQWAAAVGADLARAIGDARYPRLSVVLSSNTGGLAAGGALPARQGRPRTMDESFDFGLERVLDGMEAYMTRERAARVTGEGAATVRQRATRARAGGVNSKNEQDDE